MGLFPYDAPPPAIKALFESIEEDQIRRGVLNTGGAD
jgi:hypothetical protein